jgi:cell division septation protein DedD
MIEKKCSKCGAELIMRDGYGVCSKCGEIIGFDINEKSEEIVEEVLTPPQPAEEFEIAKDETPFVYEPAPEPEIEAKEETPEEIEDEENATEEIEFYYKDKETKKSKAPIIILVILLLCIIAVFGGYAIYKIGVDTPDVDVEDVIPEIVAEEESEIAEETPSELVEEKTEELPETGTEERKKVPEAEKEPEKEEVSPTPEKTPVPEKTPAPEVKKPVKKPQQPKNEEVAAPVAPAVSYRIRTSADDSKSQIGAFAELERAKAFATSHAAEGYKVFDMEGNLVFQP